MLVHKEDGALTKLRPGVPVEEQTTLHERGVRGTLREFFRGRYGYIYPVDGGNRVKVLASTFDEARLIPRRGMQLLYGIFLAKENIHADDEYLAVCLEPCE